MVIERQSSMPDPTPTTSALSRHLAASFRAEPNLYAGPGWRAADSSTSVQSTRGAGGGKRGEQESHFSSIFSFVKYLQISPTESEVG